MYPQRQLTLLADRKAVLRQSIARRRDQLAMDAMQVAKPMEWLDRALVLWSRIPPLAKLVSGIDDLDTVNGRIAAVFALQSLDGSTDNPAGQYGTGQGAQAPLPTPSDT